MRTTYGIVKFNFIHISYLESPNVSFDNIINDIVKLIFDNIIHYSLNKYTHNLS